MPHLTSAASSSAKPTGLRAASGAAGSNCPCIRLIGRARIYLDDALRRLEADRPRSALSVALEPSIHPSRSSSKCSTRRLCANGLKGLSHTVACPCSTFRKLLRPQPTPTQTVCLLCARLLSLARIEAHSGGWKTHLCLRFGQVRMGHSQAQECSPLRANLQTRASVLGAWCLRQS